ncbi:MAG: single-stranded DNA-binding protein [Pseudomonadota bacterium]
MKNTVTLVGFVGNTPEVRTAQSGAAITSLSLATTRSYKDGEGNRQTETEWHRITCFNGVGKGRVRQCGVNSVVASGQHFQAAFGVICSG